MPTDLIPLGPRERAAEKSDTPFWRRRDGGVPSRWRNKRVLRDVGVLVLILVIVVAGAVAWVNHDIARNLESLGDPFEALPDRPAAATAAPGENAPVNILVLGSDSRFVLAAPGEWERGGPHADAIMLVHLPADRERLYAMSFPRDAMVAVPGHGRAELSTAFSLGGPSLLVQTVEDLTGVRVDHMVAADFDGFSRLTDHLGGVTITVPETTYDSSRGRTIQAGTYQMNGADALGYVRQRHGLPGEDLDRVQRQQNWFRSLAAQALDRGARDNLYEHTSVLYVVSDSLAVDDGLTVARLRELALSTRPVDEAQDMVFFTAPVTGWIPGDDGEPAVELDRERLAAVSEAIAADDVAQFLADHPGYVETLGERVN